MLRRYCDAWFAAAKRRRAGICRRGSAAAPGMVPVRWYAGTFTLDARVRASVAKGCRRCWWGWTGRPTRWAGPVGDAAVRRAAAAGRRDAEVRGLYRRQAPTWHVWQGSTWGSSTVRGRGADGRGCWCRRRSARVPPAPADSRPGPGLLPAVPRNPGSGGHGGGGSTAVASGPPRPVMRGVSARPSTPPGPWWTGGEAARRDADRRRPSWRPAASRRAGARQAAAGRRIGT